MKKLIVSLAALSTLATAAFAAAPRTYQVTGKVTEVTPENLTVEKGKEKFEIARGDAANAAAVKVGDKVTVEYRMTAASVEVKPAGAAKKK